MRRQISAATSTSDDREYKEAEHGDHCQDGVPRATEREVPYGTDCEPSGGDQPEPPANLGIVVPYPTEHPPIDLTPSFPCVHEISVNDSSGRAKPRSATRLEMTECRPID